MEAIKILNKIYWGFYIVLLGIITPITVIISQWSAVIESLPSFIIALFILIFYLVCVFSLGLAIIFVENKWLYILAITITFLFLGKAVLSGSSSGILFHICTDWIPIYYYFKKLNQPLQ